MEIPTVSMKVLMKIWICINVHGLVIYLSFMFNVNGILFPKYIHLWYVYNFIDYGSSLLISIDTIFVETWNKIRNNTVYYSHVC